MFLTKREKFTTSESKQIRLEFKCAEELKAASNSNSQQVAELAMGLLDFLQPLIQELQRTANVDQHTATRWAIEELEARQIDILEPLFEQVLKRQGVATLGASVPNPGLAETNSSVEVQPIPEAEIEQESDWDEDDAAEI